MADGTLQVELERKEAEALSGKPMPRATAYAGEGRRKLRAALTQLEHQVEVERLPWMELPQRLKYEIEDGSYLGSCDMGGCDSPQEGWALCPVEDTDPEWMAACERCGTGVRRLDSNAPLPERYIAFPSTTETGHRVVLDFTEGTVFAQLICPAGDPCPCLVTKCPACKADLTAAESKRCEHCEEVNPDECWLKSWFDAIDGEELLQGKIEFPVDAEWDGDQPLVHIVGLGC